MKNQHGCIEHDVT